MPAFDGTGPRGQGPMTGRGQGYCAIRLPGPNPGRVPFGYAGRDGAPVRLRRRPSFGRQLGRGRRNGRGRIFRRR
jgi:hypothetical protein